MIRVRLVACLMACLFALLLTSAAYAETAAPIVAPAALSADPIRETYVNGAVWQLSAEARACFYQAYRLARYRLDDILKARDQHSKPIAIIADVDDTLVDGVMYTADVLQDGPWTNEAFFASLASNACKPLPGAVEFMQYASDQGVTLFYITNRFDAFKALTISQLTALGFPGADAEHVLLMDAEKPSSNKDARRQSVTDSYEVVLLLGDNLSDFSSAFVREQGAIARRDQVDDAAFHELWGEKWIVFPNAVYGDFTGAVNFNQKVTHEEHFQNISALFDHYKYTNEAQYQRWYDGAL